MKLITAMVVLRLGSFTVGCITFGLASYFGWAYAGWLLIPTIMAGLMCCSLSVESK